MMDDEFRQRAALEEIIQALKARAGFETLFPIEMRRKIIPLVARLQGPLPDSYDILGGGVYLETVRILREKADRALKGMEDGGPDPVPFKWENVSEHELLRSLEDLTVSMGRGKGRKEGVDISKTVPIVEEKSRWSWKRGP